MIRIMKILRAAVLALAVALVVTPASQARPIVAIGEQNPEVFQDQLFLQMKFKKARLVVPWDWYRYDYDRNRLDQWLDGAKQAQVRPLISFNRSRVSPRSLPSLGRFRYSFRAFRTQYPWIRDYSPWNEVNHKSQPTYHKPKWAARYYNVVRASCRGCTIVAADVLDQGGLEKFLKTFRRFAKGTPRIWGLHNYSDTNRFRETGTRSLLRAVRGTVWLTETGGIVKFASSLPYNKHRAARATKYMFKLARSNSRIKRLYIYAWQGHKVGTRFDAGLVGPQGDRRPAYYVVKRALRAYPR
jgi:hypothetical protein